jgi:hypothetical protein
VAQPTIKIKVNAAAKLRVVAIRNILTKLKAVKLILKIENLRGCGHIEKVETTVFVQLGSNSFGH